MPVRPRFVGQPGACMEAVNQPEAWRDLFQMIGATAGALVGLMLMVVSLHF